MEELKQRMSVVEARIAQHDGRLLQQEERLRLYAETKYVDGLLKPLETAVTKFQGAFEHINDKLDTLASGQETLNATYNQLLRDRGERESREHEKKVEILEAQLQAERKAAEERVMSERREAAERLKAAQERGFFKSLRENINPLLTFVIALVAVLSLLAGFLVFYLKNAK